MDWKAVSPTPRQPIPQKAHNWNQTVTTVFGGIAILFAMVLIRDELNRPVVDQIVEQDDDVVQINAVLQLPSPTPTGTATVVPTTTPSIEDLYGVCQPDTKSDSLCVKPTATPMKTPIIIMETPVYFDTCDVANDGFPCIVPTTSGVTDNSVVLD